MLKVSGDILGYELIDSSGGQRLERVGKYILIRPDPQVIWRTDKTNPLWSTPDAVYKRSKSGGGRWIFTKEIKEQIVKYKNLSFLVKPTNFKHLGLFAEQSPNWDFYFKTIKRADKKVKLLNLFAYTGAATVAAAAAGAEVCHVDASKGMVKWAKKNARLSFADDKPIRFIVDDCEKFVRREIRRNKKYDAIILDPPSYGRGPFKELWKLEDKLYSFLNLLPKILTDSPLFVLLNSYTGSIGGSTMETMLKIVFKDMFVRYESYDLGIWDKTNQTALPCSNTALGLNPI